MGLRRSSSRTNSDPWWRQPPRQARSVVVHSSSGNLAQICAPLKGWGPGKEGKKAARGCSCTPGPRSKAYLLADRLHRRRNRRRRRGTGIRTASGEGHAGQSSNNGCEFCKFHVISGMRLSCQSGVRDYKKPGRFTWRARRRSERARGPCCSRSWPQMHPGSPMPSQSLSVCSSLSFLGFDAGDQPAPFAQIRLHHFPCQVLKLNLF